MFTSNMAAEAVATGGRRRSWKAAAALGALLVAAGVPGSLGDGPTNYYYDASNMPSWLTPPWITSAFRTGPLAVPLPKDFSKKPGPMYAGVPAQPILPFDSQLPTDAVPVSQNYVNYPTAAIPSGRMLEAGQAPPAATDASLLEVGGSASPGTGGAGAHQQGWERYFRAARESARLSRSYAMSEPASAPSNLAHQMVEPEIVDELP